MLPMDMEPVTHMLMGACLSRAMRFPAKVRYATAACVIAAEIPDADYVYRLSGPLTYFQHHRGWTHALWSLPLQAVVICFAFYIADKMWRKKEPLREEDETPTNWLLLFAMCVLALVSHIALDWTNNYGVRPLAPWNPRWYAGDLVFIVEPLLLLFLGGALLMPLLLRLVNSEIGARQQQYPGRVLPMLALVLTLGLWGVRWVQHRNAKETAEQQNYRTGDVVRVGMNPYPVTPFAWYGVVETTRAFEMSGFNTRTGTFDTDAMQVVRKTADTPAILAAKRSRVGRVYLDWAQFPVVEEMGSAEQVHPEMDLAPEDARLRVVRFRDLRFGYPVLGRSGATALRAEAWVDGNLQVRREFFGREEQK